MAKRNRDDAWTTISTVTNDTKLPKQSWTSAYWDLDGPGREWQYFRFEVSEVHSGSYLLLSSFKFENW